MRWAPKALLAMLATACMVFFQEAANSWNFVTFKGRADFFEV